MDPVIETERLSLVPANVAHAPLLVPHCADPKIYRNLARMQPQQDLQTTQAFLEMISREPTAHVYSAFKGDQFVGVIGIELGSLGVYELGYWLTTEAWGHGYATEASAGIRTHLVNEIGLSVLLAGYFADNPASGAVLRKLDFLPCGWSWKTSAGRPGEQVWHRDVVWMA